MILDAVRNGARLIEASPIHAATTRSNSFLRTAFRQSSAAPYRSPFRWMAYPNIM
jgi:hypothetical protein